MPAIYIHWPFCISKCPYCDFNSHVGDTTDQEKWRAAYRKELEHYATLLGKSVVPSVYIGGGTPSLMEPQTVAAVLETIAQFWTLAPNAEFTIEANPSSAESSKFADFRKAGINRLSLGVQSLNDDALKFLGRAHNATEAKTAIALSQKHFERTSFDLIYGYRGQTLESWQTELAEALSMAQSHLSLYQLTIEPHTQFAVREKKGEALSCADEASIEMYEATQSQTASAGLPAYEISNHARPSGKSRHNLAYWHYDDYIGIGPGAHGRYILNGTRHAIENIRAPNLWLKQVEEKSVGSKTDEELTTETSMREALLMGLRLTEGIDMESWQKKFGIPLFAEQPPSFLSSAKVAPLTAEGLLSANKKTLRATPAGLQRLNAILEYLL